MLWFILAIATAFCVATGDALTKKFFGRFSPYDMAVASSIYSLPFLIIYIFFIPIPQLDSVFWWVAIILIPLDTFAFYLYMKAIKLSPLSISIPFLSFTPVFMIAVKRMSILFSVGYGWVLFKETNIGARMLGALFMFAGVVFIILLVSCQACNVV